MDKFLAFFHQKAVRIVAVVLLVLGIVGLALGGVGAADLTSIGKVVLGILTALGAAASVIGALVNKKQE